jgi:hypothetical protein
MTWVYLIAGLVIVAVAYERSARVGGGLLLIIVLGLLLTARRKGLI